MIPNDEDVNDVNDDEELLASDKWWSIFCVRSRNVLTIWKNCGKGLTVLYST